MAGNALSPFQVEIARLFFGLESSRGYLVAGGAALLASELIVRPTQDLDLFGSWPIDAVTPAQESFQIALDAAGYAVTVIQAGPTFSRLVVSQGDERVLVDLAIDSPPIATPTVTVLGPTLAPVELAGRKLLALFGRAAARDFADVFVLARHFDRQRLLDEAAAIDAGFDAEVLVQMLRTMDRFTDEEIPLPTEEIVAARDFFASWARELSV